MARVLIIGGSSGIGRAAIYACAKAGDEVYCAARDFEELQRIACDIDIRFGRRVIPVRLDLEDRVSIGEYLTQPPLAGMRIDHAVVTSGTMPPAELEYADTDGIYQTTAVNYLGVAAVLTGIAQRMAADGGGVIVCLSSVAGERGRFSNFVYGASKGALIVFLQGLRARMMNAKVRVITVLPGFVDTPMAYGRAPRFLTASPEYVAAKIRKITHSRRNTVYLPWFWRYVMIIIKLIPEEFFKRLRL